MSEVKREELIKAAKELNDVMGLDPQIKTGKKVTDKELIDQLLEAADLILPEDDISDETMKVIEILKGEAFDDEDIEEPEDVNDEVDEVEEEEEFEEDIEVEKEEKANKDMKSNKQKKENVSKNGRSKSNKAIVYEAWKSNITDVKELAARVDNKVKESTIRIWIAQWKKGKNLPAIAKKKDEE